MRKRISHSEDYLRYVSNICSKIGFAFFATIIAIIFDYLKTGESYLFFPWSIHAVCCIVCLRIFIFFTLLSVILLWFSYRDTNGELLNEVEHNSVFDKYLKPKLLESEKGRFISYLKEDDYSKNRIGVYAADSLRDPNFKEPTHALILRLQSRPDPDNLCTVGKRALEAMSSK